MVCLLMTTRTHSNTYTMTFIYLTTDSILVRTSLHKHNQNVYFKTLTELNVFLLIPSFTLTHTRTHTLPPILPHRVSDIRKLRRRELWLLTPRVFIPVCRRECDHREQKWPQAVT